MDSNNEYTHRGFWGDLSITMPPSFSYPDKVVVNQPVSHATYVTDFRIIVMGETIPF